MAEFPAPQEGILLTHFIVSADVERSRRFYTEVLGGETVLEGDLVLEAAPMGAWHENSPRRLCRGAQQGAPLTRVHGGLTVARDPSLAPSGASVRTRIRLLLATPIVSLALAPGLAEGASPRPGGQYFGVTSQGGNVAAQVTRDGSRVAWLELELRARCAGRRLAEPVKFETLTVRRLAVRPGGRFGRFGRIVRYDSGPGEIGERFPVVVTGRLGAASR
jgi:catechol 2,3-dioxygenase-like lactoylglutathione lyase family enzyme